MSKFQNLNIYYYVSDENGHFQCNKLHLCDTYIFEIATLFNYSDIPAVLQYVVVVLKETLLDL